MATTINTLYKPAILKTNTGSIGLFRSKTEKDMLEVHRINGAVDTFLGKVFVGRPSFHLGVRVNDNEKAVLQNHFDEIETIRTAHLSACGLVDQALHLLKAGYISLEGHNTMVESAKVFGDIVRERGDKLKLFAPVPYEISHARNEPAEDGPSTHTDDDLLVWEAAGDEVYLPYLEGEAVEMLPIGGRHE